MKLLFLPLACMLSLGSQAHAQVNIHLDINLPVAPPLVLVAPGIQVVEAFNEEVFFHQGWYWCRRPNGWYRARTPRARFVWVEVQRVPRTLIRVPSGHYRNWHRGDRRHHEHMEAQRERREERREHKEIKREQKEERKHERREEKRGHRGHSDDREHGRRDH